MEDKLYSVKELKGILRLHPKTIIRFIHEGKLKGKKIGRSWMISETDLKTYVHGELKSENSKSLEKTDYASLDSRISISAVIEIKEQNSEEASRISNSIMAMLNSNQFSNEANTRFDFIYYPESQKSKYIVYGTPEKIIEILKVFDVLSKQKEN